MKVLKLKLRQRLAQNRRRFRAVTSDLVTKLVAYFCHFPNAVILNLKFLRHCSCVYGFPVTVSRNLKVSPSVSAFKEWHFAVFLGLAILRGLFCVATLVVSVKSDRFFNPIIAPFHFVLASGIPAAAALGYLQFVKNRDEIALVWNWIYKNKDVAVKFHILHLFLYVFPSSLYFTSFVYSWVLAANPHWMPQFRFLVHLAVEEGLLNGTGPAYWGLAVISTCFDFISGFTAGFYFTVLFPAQIAFLEVWSHGVDNKILRSVPKYKVKVLRS